MNELGRSWNIYEDTFKTIEKGMKKIWPYKKPLRHGLIKSAQLDFSKRQLALYRIQGHGLITEVIRYE